MVDRSTTKWKTKKGIYEATEFGEVTVSVADTVTFDTLYATASPYNVVFWKMTDGTEMTNTHAAGTNVATITGAGTDVECIYMAYGRKSA